METNKIKYQIKQFFMNKTPNQKQYDYTYKLLDQLKDDDNTKGFYYNHMGKILLKQGKYDEAKYYLLEQLNYQPDVVSFYYQFYKISVHEKDYIEAYLDLYKYKNDNKIKLEIDITLPLAMLELCLDLKYRKENYEKVDYFIDKTNGYMLYNFENEKEINLYHEIINDFNNKNFNALYEKLIKFNKYSVDNNIPIDLKPLIEMTQNIKEMINKNQKEKIDEDFSNGITNETEKLLNSCIENKLLTEQDALNYIKKLIDLGKIDLASFLLNDIKKNYRGIDDDICNYLNSIITEEKLYQNLTDEQKNIYNECIKKGKQANRIDESIKWYSLGKKETNHPIFDYYCGKMYYKLNKYDRAYKYLNEYKEQGGTKIFQNLLYMLIIDKKTGKINKANQKVKFLKKITSYFNIDWEIDYVKKDRSFKRDINEIDIIKEIESKKISLSENLFNTKELYIEEYYNYNLSDKLELIKRLYQCRRIKLADSLLKELEKEVTQPFEKKAIESEKKRKVLYINQGKARI